MLLRRYSRLSFEVGAAAVALLCASLAQAQPASMTQTVNSDLITKDLLGSPGKEVVMTTVVYPPGGSSPAHRHDAQVFVYVLEGHVNMQVKGGKLMALGPGDTFYETPTDIHTVSANASKTDPAKFLAFLIKDKGKPVSRPAGP